MKAYLAVVVLSVIFGYYYYNPQLVTKVDPEFALASSLEKTAKLDDDVECNRVAIGYNANLDLIVKAKDVLANLKLSPPEIHHDHEKLYSLKDFQETFAYFFEKGSAGERYVEDKDIFESIVESALSLPEESKHWHIGGNAALMANRFTKEKCKGVFLGGIVSEELAKLLPSNIEVPPKESNEDSLNKYDQIHLIMEYEKGSSWGNLTSPRANRFIVVRDIPNGQIQSLVPFHKSLATFQPNLVIISGLHLLEGQPNEYRQNRLKDVAEQLTASDMSPAPIHIELASVGEIEYMKQLATLIVPTVDSLGLNEQELGSIYLALGGTEFTRDHFKDPLVSTVVKALRLVYREIEKMPHISRKLTRIHFHCLTFHLILQVKNSNWNNGKEAVAAGSVAAGRQACDIAYLDPSQVELLLPLSFNIDGVEKSIDTSDPVLVWEENSLEYYLSPVLVCKKPKKTVGLGDAISAVGLLHNKWK